MITSTDEFLDASSTGGIRPILVRPGAIHAEMIRAHLGPLMVDAVYCSLPLALRGETVADRVWLAAPMNGTGSGQLNGEPLTPGNLFAFGGPAEVAGASRAPFQCGMLSIAPSALERIATALGVKSHPPGEGEFRVASVVDRGRLSRAFDFLSHTVSHDEDVALTKREADAIERAFLEIAVCSLAGDSSRSSPYQSARLTSARIVRNCEDYARKWQYQDVTLADLCGGNRRPSGAGRHLLRDMGRHRDLPGSLPRPAAIRSLAGEITPWATGLIAMSGRHGGHLALITTKCQPVGLRIVPSA